MRPVLLSLLLVLPAAALAQEDVGHLGFLSSPGISGTRQSFGGADYFSFSDGSFTTRRSLGSTEYYTGSTPSLSGSVQRLDNLGFGLWLDGTTSMHQSFDGLGVHSFQRGSQSRQCTSLQFGGQTFINCP